LNTWAVEVEPVSNGSNSWLMFDVLNQYIRFTQCNYNLLPKCRDEIRKIHPKKCALFAFACLWYLPTDGFFYIHLFMFGHVEYLCSLISRGFVIKRIGWLKACISSFSEAYKCSLPNQWLLFTFIFSFVRIGNWLPPFSPLQKKTCLYSFINAFIVSVHFVSGLDIYQITLCLDNKKRFF